MNFVGSKGGAGVAQWLIGLMPAHRVYCECFLGKGVVMQAKRPAAVNIGIDYDAGVIANYHCRPAKTDSAIIHGDALTMLQALNVQKDWLIYADPPYLMSVRSSKRSYYGREFFTDAEHDRLLSILIGLQGMVMISGYQSELYSRRLKDWRVSTFWTVNRRGKRVQEVCWMNFSAPIVIHDARAVGANFTDRQRVKRKVERWRNKFTSMPDLERQAVLESLLTVRGLHSHSRQGLTHPTRGV